jgi:putative oxidoreductase
MFGGMPPDGGSVQLMSQMGLAGVLEFFGGLLLVLGLFTRPVAAVLALEMLVAFFQAHFPRGGVPLENGGEVPLLYMLVWLFFAGNGAGPASIDAARRRGAP